MKFGHRVCELGCAVPYLLANGEQPGKVLKRVGMPTHMLLDPDAWVPRELFLALVNAMSSATGDPHCGIHVGEMESFVQFEAFGAAILDAPTLRTAIGVACRRTSLIQTGTKIRLSENRRTAHLSYSFLGRTGENPASISKASSCFFRNFWPLPASRLSFDFAFCMHSAVSDLKELETVGRPNRLGLSRGRECCCFRSRAPRLASCNRAGRSVGCFPIGRLKKKSTPSGAHQHVGSVGLRDAYSRKCPGRRSGASSPHARTPSCQAGSPI